MAKDYAKYGTKKRKPAGKFRYRNLFFIFGILAATSVLSSAIYIHRHHLAAAQSHASGWIAQTKPQAVKVEAKAQTEEVHFDFYNELPSMQMSVSTEKTLPSPPRVPKQSTKRDGYVVKIAQFKTENEAVQLRLSLLLEGVEAEVVKTGEAYRVQRGGYATSVQAKSGQKELQKLGIESVVEKA